MESRSPPPRLTLGIHITGYLHCGSKFAFDVSLLGPVLVFYTLMGLKIDDVVVVVDFLLADALL